MRIDRRGLGLRLSGDGCVEQEADGSWVVSSKRCKGNSASGERIPDPPTERLGPTQ